MFLSGMKKEKERMVELFTKSVKISELVLHRLSQSDDRLKNNLQEVTDACKGLSAEDMAIVTIFIMGQLLQSFSQTIGEVSDVAFKQATEKIKQDVAFMMNLDNPDQKVVH